MNLTRGKFRVRGDTIEVHPAYEETAVRIELFGDEIEQITVVDPLTGERLAALDELAHLPRHPLRRRRGADAAGDRPHRGRAAGAAGLLRARGQAARGPAAAHAHAVRPRDDAGGRLLQRHRELLGADRRPGPGRGAQHAARLLPRRLPARHRRVPRHRPPAPRPVRGRPHPQGDAHRPRLPAAVGGRQPAAALRRVRRAGQPGRLPVGHARRPTSSRSPPRWSSRSCGPPGWSTPRSSSSRPRARSTT